MIKYALLLLSLLNLHCSHETISSLNEINSKRNLFYKVNVNVENTGNNIFQLLKLNDNFTKLHKIQLLLSMHATMKNIAENIYPQYRDLQRTAKAFLKKKNKKGLFNLNKLIGILVKEKLTPGDTKMFNDQTQNITGIHLKIASFEVPDNQEEVFASLKKYLSNSGSYNHNMDNPLQKIKKEFEKNEEKLTKKRRKLKTWKAPNTTAVESPSLRRVYQGKPTLIKKFPFLASIHVTGEFVCAGSVINRMMVITAASCLHGAYYNGSIDNISVRVGSDYTDSKGHIFSATRIVFHPFYDPDTLDNNLAILKLGKAMKLKGKAKIRRIAYKKLGGLHGIIKEIVIVGWGGKDSAYNGRREPPFFSHLDIFHLDRCIEVYSSTYVNQRHFCGGFNSKGSGACQRDIGGPGIAGSTLVGVVSFGPPVCGTPNAPTVFTNLAYYFDWIDDVITELSSEMNPMHMRASRFKIVSAPESATNLRGKQDSSTSKEEQHNTTKTVTPYPKAIQVLTYLLNELISAGKGFDDSDENSNTTRIEQEKEDFNDISVKSTKLLSYSDNVSTGYNKTLTTSEDKKNSLTPIFQSSPSTRRKNIGRVKLMSATENPTISHIQSSTKKEVKEVPTKSEKGEITEPSQPQNLSDIIQLDPLLKVVKNVGNYFGLSEIKISDLMKSLRNSIITPETSTIDDMSYKKTTEILRKDHKSTRGRIESSNSSETSDDHDKSISDSDSQENYEIKTEDPHTDIFDQIMNKDVLTVVSKTDSTTPISKIISLQKGDNNVTYEYYYVLQDASAELQGETPNANNSKSNFSEPSLKMNNSTILRQGAIATKNLYRTSNILPENGKPKAPNSKEYSADKNFGRLLEYININ